MAIIHSQEVEIATEFLVRVHIVFMSIERDLVSIHAS